MLNIHEAFFHLLFFDLLDDFVKRGEMSAFEAALRKIAFIEQEHITTDELKLMMRQQGKTVSTMKHITDKYRKEATHAEEAETKRKA